MASSDHFAKSSWMLTIVSVAVVGAILYLAKGVLVPLTLAALLSFLLAPVCDWFERWKLGRVPAMLVTVTLTFLLLGSGAWTAASQMIELAPRIPEYQNNVHSKLDSLNNYLSDALRKVTRSVVSTPIAAPLIAPDAPIEAVQEQEERPTLVRVVSTPQSPLEVMGRLFGSMLVAMGSTLIVIVLVVFFLIRREDLRDRFIHLVGRGQVNLTTQTLEDASARVSRYLLMQLFVNITFGVPVAIGLYFIGVPNAMLWGILATALRFIPYIGAWSAAAAPIGLSLAISKNWLPPLLAIGLFVTLELLVANVVEPWIYGKHTGVSSVAILVAAVFWTWIWGPIGLLLSTPLSVCLLAIGKHVPQFAFLDILLGNEPVFEPKMRVYQRLLAGDQEETTELVEEFFEAMPLVEVYDTVLIPALALSETNWHRDNLDEARHKFILDVFKETVEDLGDRQRERTAQDLAKANGLGPARSDPPAGTNAEKPCILCLPARDAADELAATMLAQVMEMSGNIVQVISVTALASEMVELIEQRQPDVVCISAMPPAAATHARYLCKRLRGRFPEANLIVGLWNAKGDMAKAKERIGCGDAVHLVATLAEAQEKIRRLVQPLLLRPAVPVKPEQIPPVLEKAC